MLRSCTYSNIQGWDEDNHQYSLETFQRSALEMLQSGHAFKRPSANCGARQDWLAIAEASLEAVNAKHFFETNFKPFRVEDDERPDGLFTGYYEPAAQGSMDASKNFNIPIYKKPPELVPLSPVEQTTTGLSYGHKPQGRPEAYFTRKEIEQGALAGRNLEICFLNSAADAFFIHVQGNGRVQLPNGKTIRLSFAAKNGRPYSGIGAELLRRGVGTPQTMSMQLLRAWMIENPEQVQEFLWTNQSFIFFQETEITQPGLGAIGAAKVNLTPGRSLAVDRSQWMFGTPLFIQTHQPPEAGGVPYNRLMIAQDTGTAIKGAVRGDVYWGWGEGAALNAGHMKSKGKMIALLPNPIADRISK